MIIATIVAATPSSPDILPEINTKGVGKGVSMWFY